MCQEEVASPSPLIGRFIKFSKMSKDYTQQKKNGKASSHHHSKSLSCSKYTSSRQSDIYKFEKYERKLKEI